MESCINVYIIIQKINGYEVRDGKLYKRLYNYSKDKWVGDWILCV